MVEYRVKGLSCANCAQSLETEIQKLEHGRSAKLSYTSGKLLLDPRIPVSKVEKILKFDGAYIDRSRLPFPSGHAHTEQSESASRRHLAAHEHHSHTSDAGLMNPVHNGHEHTHDSDLGSPYRSGNGHTHAGAHPGHGHMHGDAHGHMYGGAEGKRTLILLIAAGAIYAAAFILSGFVSSTVVIPLYLAATVISGYSTFIRGLRNLFRLQFNIDTLMTIALAGALAIGEWKEGTLVAILFGVNELLEGMGMEKARRSMESLLQTAPKEAILLADGRERVVPIASLQIGDIVVVKPGEKIPSDGTVESGASSVNEAAITGESLPVDKSAGATVLGGSINNEGLLHVRIDRAYRDSSLAKILHLVEEAQETRTPTELFINKFAKYYTPFIIAVAVLVMTVPPLLLGGSWGDWLYQGLAVLIVGCPCALILSSPIAIVSGITRNARNGILVKGGVFLEMLGKIDTVAFDKTGTLTKGSPKVETLIVYDEARFLPVSAAIEATSTHPLASAIMNEIGRADIVPAHADRVLTVPGKGVEAVVDGVSYWLGSEQIAAHLTVPDAVQLEIRRLKEKGMTLVLLADRDSVLGIFGITDEIRPESQSVVAALHRLGIRRTVMLTGDHERTARKVAEAVGVTAAYGGLLPEHKAAKIKELSEGGHVAMIGDGINDAPALATAPLGIAMGKGTDSAIETADIVLMQDHLGKLPEAVSIAKKVNRIIRINISLALALKAAALLLTIPGWLTLWFAILSDMGATVIVTLISLTVLMKQRRSPRLAEGQTAS